MWGTVNLVYCVVCVQVLPHDDLVTDKKGYITFYSWAHTVARCLRLGAVFSGCDDFPRETLCVWGIHHRGAFAEESCGSRLSQQRCLQKSQLKLDHELWSPNICSSNKCLHACYFYTLTIYGDMNTPLLCGPMFKLEHTGQVLPFVKIQSKLIRQPGFHSTSIMFWLQGCLTFGVFRKNPAKVHPDILPCEATHSQPQTRIVLSHQRHTQLRGFWKKRRGERKEKSSCMRLGIT